MWSEWSRQPRPCGGLCRMSPLPHIYGRFTEGFDTADLREAKGLLEPATRSLTQRRTARHRMVSTPRFSCHGNAKDAVARPRIASLARLPPASAPALTAPTKTTQGPCGSLPVHWCD